MSFEDILVSILISIGAYFFVGLIIYALVKKKEWYSEYQHFNRKEK
jgi:hypothetical protein